MKTPSHFELYQSIRKVKAKPSICHRSVKGKGSYTRKGKKDFD